MSLASASLGTRVIPLTRPGTGQSVLRLVRDQQPVANRAPVYRQGSLSLRYPVPAIEPGLDRPALRIVGPAILDEDGTEPDRFFERQPTSDSQLPDPTQWSARLVQALLEIRTGRRPMHQLVRWTNSAVYAQLRAQTQGHREHEPLTVITSMRVSRPADGVAEVSVVVTGRNRSRAIVLRLEGWDGRWLCTTLAQV